MDRASLIQSLRDAALRVDEDDNIFFGTAMRDSGLHEDEIARLFSVSRPTADRWISGKTSPHRVIKHRCYEILADHLAKI